MPARLRARNPPVPIVVVARERIVPGRRCGSGAGHRGRRHGADDGLERRTVAAGKDVLERLHLAPVDGEPVGLTDLDDTCREPAAIPGGNPLGCVATALLVSVHLGGGEGEVAEVAAEAGLGLGVRGTQSGIVGLARGDHVLDVSLGRRFEAPPRVGPVHGAEVTNDVLLDRQRGYG